MIRRDRVGGFLLVLVMVAPSAAAFQWFLRSPPAQREGVLVLLLTSAILPATLGVFALLLFDRRGRGLLLRAIRGGQKAVIEVRARSGVGGVLLLPLDAAVGIQRVYRIGLKRFVVADASALTAVGEVVFARGGTSLDPELTRWLDALAASDGSASPGEGAVHPDAIAAAASRDPLAAPSPIEASLLDGWPTWRYRTAPGRERELILSWMALLGTWLAVYPAWGIFSAGALAAFVVPAELVLAYLLVLAGPVTVEFQARGPMLLVRRKRFGVTLSIGVSDGTLAGVDSVSLPAVSLRFGRRSRGGTSPVAGGPDLVAMAWLSAAIRACSAQKPSRHAGGELST